MYVFFIFIGVHSCVFTIEYLARLSVLFSTFLLSFFLHCARLSFVAYPFAFRYTLFVL